MRFFLIFESWGPVISLSNCQFSILKMKIKYNSKVNNRSLAGIWLSPGELGCGLAGDASGLQAQSQPIIDRFTPNLCWARSSRPTQERVKGQCSLITWVGEGVGDRMWLANARLAHTSYWVSLSLFHAWAVPPLNRDWWAHYAHAHAWKRESKK